MLPCASLTVPLKFGMSDPLFCSNCRPGREERQRAGFPACFRSRVQPNSAQSRQGLPEERSPFLFADIPLAKTRPIGKTVATVVRDREVAGSNPVAPNPRAC